MEYEEVCILYELLTTGIDQGTKLFVGLGLNQYVGEVGVLGKVGVGYLAWVVDSEDGGAIEGSMYLIYALQGEG